MTAPIYKVDSGATFWNSLASPALQTAMTVTSTATDYGLQLKKVRLGFNGVTASNTPVIVRLYVYTVATSGTSTASTPLQVSGRTIAATNMAGAFNFTAEPTVKAYFDEWSLTPNGGTVIYDYPLGDEPDYFNSGNMGFGLEITPAQQVGVTSSMWVTRI